MKLLYSFIFFGLINFQAIALERGEMAKILKSVTSSVLMSRCDYIFAFEFLQKFECKKYSKVLTKILDIDSFGTLKESSGAIFVGDLVYLLEVETEQTQAYLEGLASHANYSGGFKDKFNLWEYTVDFYQDEKKAIMILGVLFQDIDARLHINYIQDRLGVKDKLIELLLLTNELLYADKKIEMYPRHVVEGLEWSRGMIIHGRRIDSNLYHFYNIAYLSLKLQKNIPKRWSYFLPFLLNSSYEYFKNGMLGGMDEDQMSKLIGPYPLAYLKTILQVLLPTRARPLGEEKVWSAVDIYLGAAASDFAHDNPLNLHFDALYTQLRYYPNKLIKKYYLFGRKL